MYRLPFELTDSAKLLHFTTLGESPLNDVPDQLYIPDTIAAKSDQYFFD